MVAWGRAPEGWFGLVEWSEHLYRAGEPDLKGRTVIATAWLPAARLHSRQPYDGPVPVRRARLTGREWPADDVPHDDRLAYWHFGLLTGGGQPDVPGWVPYGRRTL